MSDAVSPTMRRRRFGNELRKLRNSQGLSATEAAKTAGTSQTKLSAVEGGRRRLTTPQLDKLIKLYKPVEAKASELRILHEQGDELGWWEQYSDVLPDTVELLAGLEAGSAWIREWHGAFLPVLLQTEEYSQAVVASSAPYLRSADIPRIVEFRTLRQQKLNDPGFRLTAVVDESALRRQVAGRDAMRRQLDAILNVDCPATVEVHVLPFEAGAHPCQGQEFSLLEFPDPDDPEVVFVDIAGAAGFLERPQEIRRHTSAFSVSMSKAIDLDASRRRIETIVADLAG